MAHDEDATVPNDKQATVTPDFPVVAVACFLFGAFFAAPFGVWHLAVEPLQNKKGSTPKVVGCITLSAAIQALFFIAQHSFFSEAGALRKAHLRGCVANRAFFIFRNKPCGGA
ncbi:MAG: hypothetical protein LBQ33_02055 [Oscillospiraceae bacterium]|nr:hypothetical protein [Oscillospiraceae bacterium]